MVALLLAGSSGRASGFVQSLSSEGKPAHWDSLTVTFDVYLEGFPGLTADEVRAAVRQAALNWSRWPCVKLHVEVRFLGGVGPVPAEDGVSTIVAQPRRFCRQGQPAAVECLPGDAQGASAVYLATATGVIREADIEINAEGFSWSLQREPGKAYLTGVLTREIGHALGLEAPCWDGQGARGLDGEGLPAPECASAPEQVRESALSPLTTRANVSSDDEAGICRIYEPVSDSLAERGGCSAAPGAPRAPGTLLVAALLALLALVTRAWGRGRPSSWRARARAAARAPARAGRLPRAPGSAR
jgi:hypothetical protein